MNESTGDGGCNCASFFQVDLSNLVIWAHTHGSICNQIPSLEFMQNTGHLSQENAVLWMCRMGHAYHWQYGKIHDRGGEGIEAVGRKRGLQFSEASAREDSFREKRLKLAPSSFERAEADAGSMGSCGRCPGVTQQEADTACTRHKEASPAGSQNTREPMASCSAAEQHSTLSGVRVQTGGQNVTLKNNEDSLITSGEKQCVADEDKQGDKIKQSEVSEPPAQVDLQMLQGQKLAFHQQTASQKPAFAPTARLPVAHAYILQSPGNEMENPGRNTLKLGPSTSAGPMAETPGARNPPESEAPNTEKPPVPSPEVKDQLESCPMVTFFEFQATVDIPQQLQLSFPEHGTPGTGSSGNSAENVAEESSPLGSGQAPHCSSFQSSGSHPSTALKRGVLKTKEEKGNCTTGNIKIFTDWLLLHYPSETREIHTLPPADLDHYLASFFSSIKKEDGMDFSVHSFVFLQDNIKQYLKEHNYQYNMVRGLEFRASQKAWNLKHQVLIQKKREEEWSILENLTDKDVENLHKKGIFSKTQPQGFLYLMFTNIVRGFGASTHSQRHQLYWGQLVLRKSEGEVEYLEWRDDLGPETKKKKPGPRLFAKPNDPENCLVTNYKKYARKRPPDMLKSDSPLYLSPRSLVSLWDRVWYGKRALTRVKMEKILKVIVQQFRRAIRKPRK